MSEMIKCPFCGEFISSESLKCIYCKENLYEAVKEDGPKSFLKTALFCFFFGHLGVHRFYTGYIGLGVLQLLTGGGFGLWQLIDLISILLGNYNDSLGRPLSKTTKTPIAGVLSFIFGILYALLVVLILAIPSASMTSEVERKAIELVIAAAFSPIGLGLIAFAGDSGKKFAILSILLSLSTLIIFFIVK